MSRANRTLASFVQVVLVTHIVITIVDNLPHEIFSLRIRMLPIMKKIPQWRFFAPNPGNEDLFLMFRTRDSGGVPWQPWQNVPLAPEVGVFTPIWNPRSRTPKAFFDITHQCRMLAGNSSGYEWLLQSEAYELLAQAVRRTCLTATPEAGQFQFMILGSFPRAGREGLTPIMVSPPEDLSPTATAMGSPR